MALEKFLKTYNKLNSHNLELLAEIYSRNVRFIDPVHEINGLQDLQRYFAALYENSNSVSFTFEEQVGDAHSAFVSWKMHFSHPSLDRGKTITVNGVSHLRFNSDGLVAYHRDYFDLGAMAYEHIPILGTLVRTVKRRLAK